MKGENGAPSDHRTFTIASYALCGFANLGSLGIQIGVLGALAPSRAKIIASTAVSAMFCGFISYVSICSSYDHHKTDALASHSTMQAAGIAGMLV